MRLQRGSGVKGLAAMNDVCQCNDVCILRPLLDVHPDVLKEYLIQKYQMDRGRIESVPRLSQSSYTVFFT